MSTWGSGSFENDTAADHLYDFMGRMLDDMREVMAHPEEYEPDEYWGDAFPVHLEILALLAAQPWSGIQIPPPEEVASWQQCYMQVWDRNIDDLDPDADYKVERRQMLDALFERLKCLAALHHTPAPE